MPGGEVGDPRVEKFDGQSFQFRGEHGKRYNLATLNGFRIYTRSWWFDKDDPASVEYLVGCDIYCPAAATVEASNDGTIRLTCGEWRVRIERKLCLLPVAHHPETPPEPATVTYTSPGECELYAQLSEGVSFFHSGIKTRAQFFGCSLDAPTHWGNTTDEPHPLQGIAHLNVFTEAVPANLTGATGLMVDGDHPGATAAEYEVGG